MRGRLLGAGAGLVGGAVIGVIVSFVLYPEMEWPMRLVLAAVVGAVGLLLGSIKGI
jgi:peptidoglycan/LPS O-acetylase OafA/YrhL